MSSEAGAQPASVAQDVDAPVLRLLKPIPDFIPESGDPPLTWMAFQPSNDDKAQAEKSMLPVRVSVFDRTRTTIAQARSFRKVPCKAFELGTAGFGTFRAKCPIPPTRIVSDLVDDEDKGRPGADGHCGIEGLERGTEPKPDWKTRLQRLADECRSAEGEDEHSLAPPSTPAK